jgi:hypothetical protein
MEIYKENMNQLLDIPTFEEMVDVLHSRSMESGAVEFLGPLASPELRQNWQGSISLDKRKEDHEIDDSSINEAKRFLAMSFVECDPDGYVRCIDGRPEEGYDDEDPLKFGQKLGPQEPGGDLNLAVAWRLATGLDEQAATIVSDIDSLLINRQLDFKAGNHVDDNRCPGRTGCKAFDGIEQRIADISPETLPEIKSFLIAMLGDQYSSAVLDKVISNSNKLLGHGDQYFSTKEEALNDLQEKSPGGLVTLVGQHKEVILSINLVQGETFQRDHFSSHFDGNIQAFNFDVWRSFNVAQSLFPNDLNLQQNFLHARLATALTTAMDLTDGSLILAIRRPNVQ